MTINFTGIAMEKPKDMPIKASLAWDYFSFNNGGWVAVVTGDGGVLMMDESCDISEHASVFRSEEEFIDWLVDDANERLADEPLIFLRECGAVREDLCTPAVAASVLMCIERKEKEERERYGDIGWDSVIEGGEANE